jgi:FADH2 O2-dependent halogenase
VLQNTPVKDISITENHVEIHTKEEVFIAGYIVDSGGYKSLLAEKYQLRDRNLKTHSRAIFTHMVDVPDFHHVSNAKDDYGFPFSVAEGTLHHIFDGGWMWVIPFNNHDKSTNPLCSVGLMLDPRMHPENKELSAKEEFCDFISQFPDIARQFSQAKAVRPWTRTGRIQYSSKEVVGDRFALLGHAAGFIDPLFSKGMYVSFSSAFQLAHLLLSADENYSTEHFKGFETRTLDFIQSHDRLVANSYKSFSNHKLWNVYLILWLLGAYTELVKLMSSRILARSREDYIQQTQHLELVGGGFDAFKVLEKKVNKILENIDPCNEKDVDRAVSDITVHFEAIDWLPKAFQEVLKGKNHLPEKKLNADLFQRDSGFLGKGSYRKHFFGGISATELVKIFINEKNAYSEKQILGMK